MVNDQPSRGWNEPMPSEGPGVSTPEDVHRTLLMAFGKDVGETGYQIAAVRCCSEEEKMEAVKKGSSLLYGELLPDGVSKMLLPGRLGNPITNGSIVLELGMGSGKVALQIFLQCPGVTVLGVELVRSRFSIAESALLRLSTAAPHRFWVSAHVRGEHIRLQEVGNTRFVEFRCCDFFSCGLDLCCRSDVIVFAVNIPCQLFPELCRRLSHAKDGCRLFTYHPLESIWWTEELCPFHQCEANIPDSDTYATSWSPQGYKFYIYVSDGSRKSPISNHPRNEVYSEWKCIWDETRQAYYYHNEETEISQWEVPHYAGCWQAVLSEEHSACYYWHQPSGYSQWEVPKCLADLGWGREE